MKQTINRFLTFLTITALTIGIVSPFGVLAAEPATNEEIQQLLSGNTLQGSAMKLYFPSTMRLMVRFAQKATPQNGK